MPEAWKLRRKPSGQERGRRRGEVFPLRLTAAERSELEELKAKTAGPRGLGPWLQWAARQAARARVLPAANRPELLGGVLERVIPRGPGRVIPRSPARVIPRLILDLCSGSGSWSKPYELAGYEVIRVTLPAGDVRGFEPPPNVWGVLAAPPCTEFSIAKNGQERDFATGLETVCACLRVIALARPHWWALENPTGLLGRWLGPPSDVFEPYEFGDAWTKRTALWGAFALPARGPFVTPEASAMDRPTADARAVTPPGFARAFFEANP